MKNKIRLLPLLLLFLIGQLPASGQINKIEYQEFTLDNGLHVILHEDHTTPVVAINVMYHVGSKNEQPDRTGFAHFFEHLMFEGSPNIARGQYFKLIQNAGGENNAFTSFDKTDYYEVLPSNQVALGIWMESERMLHLKIDTVGLETQRKVVKEERKQRYENQPYGSFMSNIFDLAFKGTPYQWVPIGEAQYIDQAKLSEFRDFYKHYYVPNNASLSIAGDIDPVKTRKLVEEYFGIIPAGKETIIRPQFKEA
ncbi:MAG TPA: pitrilysin family protein, partial [Bacteroidales bacterium]|nr:pitrilysin family protein [Bacteroidales bacterium]